MANISTYLNNILSAIYGKDVRRSIHDGIKKINEEVESNVAAEVGRVDAEIEREQAENLRKSEEVARSKADQERTRKTAQAIGDVNTVKENAIGATLAAETTTSNMQTIIDDMLAKIESDYYRGPQGIKGDKGDRGDSGIVVPTKSMFTLSGDEAGNLYAYYSDDSTPPTFEVDEADNVYYVVPETEG